MKKIFIFILFFICISTSYAKEIEVTFSDCVDGDTAKFIYNDNEITARFLAIDTPETVHPTKEDEEFGKEASDFTCNKIKAAKKIILEYDDNSDKTDKYDRHLVWVFLDEILLQEQLVENGLADIAYLYGDYKYTNKLEKAKQYAEDNRLGIWNNSIETQEMQSNKETNNNTITSFVEKYKEYIILIGSLIIVSIFNLKSKKRIKTKLKRKIIKDIKKRL